MKFVDMGLSESTLKALEKKWFVTASPIQEACIPLLLNGTKDIIWQAQTGTGKTAAFSLPVIEKIDLTKKHVQAVVIAPTRELAVQVAEEFKSLAGKKKISIVQVYGWASIGNQLSQLRSGAHVVVGTPWRMIDMINRGKLKLGKIDFCILDEADEMLNMWFLDELESILEACNKDRQMLCFSATMPKAIKRVAEKYMGEYEFVKAAATELTTWNTEQLKMFVRQSDKLEALTRVMDSYPDFYGIIFSKTKRWCDELVHALQTHGYRADALHGDLNQKQREWVLKKFKKKQIMILCATDVAARGIDVEDLSHVVNYDLPQDPESYTHRIWRTGRAGKKWIALSFVTQKGEWMIRRIERTTKSKIKLIEAPTVEDVIDRKKTHILEKIAEAVRTGSEGNRDYDSMIEKCLELGSEKDLMGALLHLAFGKQLNEKAYRDIKSIKPRNEVNSDMTRLFIARGRAHGMDGPKELVDRLQWETNVSQKVMDDVMVKDDFSFITCPNAEAEVILEIFAEKEGRSLVSVSKERERGERSFWWGKRRGWWWGKRFGKKKSGGGKAYYGKDKSDRKWKKKD